MSLWKTLTVVLGGMVVTLLFVILNQNNVAESTLTENIELNFYKANFQLNNSMIKEKITKDSILIEKHSYNSIMKLVNKKSILIYKYSELNCNTCYENELTILHTVFNTEQDKDIVAILCSYSSINDFIVFKKMNKIKLPIYRIPEFTFEWEAEKYGNPYYFVLHSDMSVSNFFMPDKIFPEITEQYLSSIKQFLSE